VAARHNYSLGAEMDIADRQDCEFNIRRIEELLSCGIFEPRNSGNTLQSAAFIELVICLRDLLHKTEKYAKRISFADDVMTNDYVHDITDAVTAVRDACCHIDSFKRHFDDRGNRGSFVVVYGKGNLAKIGDLELRSDYADDIAFFYGKNRLYINRHIVRAFKEAQALLAPILAKRPF
jgi:hypothetical protein